MQILFVHPNFPAQFAGTLRRLSGRSDVECVFLSRVADGMKSGVRCIRYEPKGGATQQTHHCSRTFENATWHAHAVYESCKAAGLAPDLIVGHSGFGTTAFLPELYDAPILNYFEYFYRPHGSDMDFRPEFPPAELDLLRARARNAMILIDLETCARGYTPTPFQHQLFPEEWRPKIEVIPDGVDLEVWTRREGPRVVAGEALAEDVQIVTYVARGLEAMRGFDIFVRVAKRMLETRRDLVFCVVGEDRSAYGNDARHIPGESFAQHVIAQEGADPAHFRFLGRIPPRDLAALLSLSNLHIYLTVPFVLSWSLLDAMACSCAIVASDTPPLHDVIDPGVDGLLAPFADVDGLAAAGLRVLGDEELQRSLGAHARARIEAEHDLDVVFPKIWRLFESYGSRRGPPV